MSNQLEAKQKHQVNMALMSLHDSIRQDRLSASEVARTLTERLGFAVCERNVRTAAKATGLVWPVSRSTTPPTSGKSARVGGAFYQRLSAAEATINVLRQKINDLCRDLGVPGLPDTAPPTEET